MTTVTPSLSPVLEEFSPEAKEFVRGYIHKVSHDGLHNLRLQYNDLRTFTPANFSHAASDANPTKCRYKDIICLDSSRVVLRWPPGMTDDFVHANWVTHELFENRFICSQAPLDATVCDFWRVCWQEDVRQIIMLCRCEEMGKAKCAQYWPTEVDQEKTMPYGLTIKCLKLDQSDKNFIHTKLLVTFGQEKRRVDHRQWTTWPDKSVPQTPLAPFRLLHFTRKFKENPSLIHCSAGVGRTGTMVAIEMMYKSLLKCVTPDTPKLLQSLRSQRFMAVQTEDQYVYCHYAIIQFAYAKGMAEKHDVKVFCKEYNNYVKMVLDNGCRPPPLNATKPPLDCAYCVRRKQQNPNSKFIDSKASTERTHLGNSNTEQGSDFLSPSGLPYSTTPLQTQITPANLSPAHCTRSMPNWDNMNISGNQYYNQQQTQNTNDGLSNNPKSEHITAAYPGNDDFSAKAPMQGNQQHHQMGNRAASAYTVLNSNESKKVHYKPNPNRPYVKAIAGMPNMQVTIPKNQLDAFNQQINRRVEEIEKNRKATEGTNSGDGNTGQNPGGQPKQQ